MINAETQKPDGFDVDLAAAITNTLGVKSEHNDIGFDALIPSLQAGQCDAIISGLANRPKRREVVDFVDYAIAGNSLLTKADSNAYFNSLEDLSGLKVYSFKIPVSVTEYTFNPEAHINPSPGSISVRGSSNITYASVNPLESQG